MQLPPHLLRSLRDAYRSAYGKDITEDDAHALGWALVSLFGGILDARSRVRHEPTVAPLCDPETNGRMTSS